MPADSSLDDVLVRVHSLLIDLQRHVDRAALDRDVAQVARAWVRAAQAERLLRSVLPADVAANPPDVGEPEVNAGHRAHPDTDGPSGAPPPTG